MKRTVLLLRHATTEDFRPGFQDRDRRLTERGEAEADELGAWLREQGEIEQILCSTAVRTRQTLDRLRLPAAVDYSESIYSGDADTVVTAVRELDDAITRCLLIGHSPAIPSAAHELADPAISDREALTTLERRYPPATLAVLEFAGSWADLAAARLTSLRLP